MNIPFKLELGFRKLFGIGAGQGYLGTMGFQRGYSSSSNVSNNIINAYRYLPWLRSIFGKIGEGVGSTTWFSQKVLEKRGRKFVNTPSLIHANQAGREKILNKAIKDGTYEVEILLDSPLLKILSEPNPFMTGITLMKLTCLYLDLAGRALWWVEKKNGVPVKLWPIPPGWVTQYPTRENPFYKISDSMFRDDIPMEEVISFNDPDPADPYRNTVGAATPLSDELEADEYAAKHIGSWFRNRARPDFMVSGTGLIGTEAREAENKWKQKLSGWWNAHQPIFMSKDVKIHELNNKFSEMELVSLRKWQRNVVLQGPGLPPEILGVIESSNRATITAAGYIFARYVLVPRIEIIRSGIQRFLVPMMGLNEIIEYNSPVEENREFKLEVMKEAPWAFTFDDWRELAGMRELPGGQGHAIMIPAQYTPTRVEDIDNYQHPYANS